MGGTGRMKEGKSYRVAKYVFEAELTLMYSYFEIHDLKDMGVKYTEYHIDGKRIATWIKGTGWVGDKIEKCCAYMLNVGDRVMHVDSYSKSCSTHHGIVVYFNGEHNWRLPRIRWQSGWGTGEKACCLKLLSFEDKIMFPVPRIMACDLA